MTIDLNSDLCEGAGFDQQILDLVSSANIACGFHAGTPPSILQSIIAAQERGVAIGAHPSFDDRANFGRTEIAIPANDLSSLIAFQLGGFAGLCRAAGTKMTHVKPHGALYNISARDAGMAEVVCSAIRAFDPKLFVFAPPASQFEIAAQTLKLAVVREFFADRNYNADGSLVSRARPDALLHDPLEAAERVIRMLRQGMVRTIAGSDFAISAETICVHGDTPGAVEFVRKLRASLEQEGITIAPPHHQ